MGHYWPYNQDNWCPYPCLGTPDYQQIAEDYERRLYAFWDENERLRKALKKALWDFDWVDSFLMDAGNELEAATRVQLKGRE